MPIPRSPLWQLVNTESYLDVLVSLGIGSRAIEHRVQRDRLHPLHRGVYAVGHRVTSRHGQRMAAVLAGGPGAVLSHRSAAALHGLRAPGGGAPEVTVGAERRRHPGILFHVRDLPDDERTVILGIPTTTVPRTLFDLATVLAPRQVERAIEEAELRRLTDHLSLPDLVARYPGRRGVAIIRSLLADLDFGSTVTRSELEERFLAFLDDHGFQHPAINAGLSLDGRWIEADALWRSQRLVVELDSHAFHSSAAAFERDRARDRALSVAGWRVVRVTWRQLLESPERLAADLRHLLAAG